jgi:hypothetical protein
MLYFTGIIFAYELVTLFEHKGEIVDDIIMPKAGAILFS